MCCSCMGLHLYKVYSIKTQVTKFKIFAFIFGWKTLPITSSKQRNNHLACWRLGITLLPDRVPSPKDFFSKLSKVNQIQRRLTRQDLTDHQKKLLRSLHLQFLMRKAGYHSYRGTGHGGSDVCRSRNQKPMSFHSNPFGHHSSVSVWNHQFR